MDLQTGTSRRRLRKLLSEIGTICLFVHDSSHTERNIMFELQQAWEAIRRGAIVADDVHSSAGFARFAAHVPAGTSFVVRADDARGLFGIVFKIEQSASAVNSEATLQS